MLFHLIGLGLEHLPVAILSRDEDVVKLLSIVTAWRSTEVRHVL